jgi:tripartite motif-containing protein 71
VFVKIPPTQLGKPVKVIGGVRKPVDIAINSVGELLVAKAEGDIISIDKRGQKVQRIHKVKYGFKELNGIAVDNDDNIYLTDRGSGKLFKFSCNYELVKELGIKNFNPGGIIVVKEQVIVGSRGHPTCIHILDRNLNLEKTIALGKIGVKDVAGIAVDDSYGNLYLCDFSNGGIHVISVKDQGELLYSFGQEQLKNPYSIHYTSGGLVYISTWRPQEDKISVFTKEGTLVASFGSEGREEGQFRLPSALVFDPDGYLYVCDYFNHRLQLF